MIYVDRSRRDLNGLDISPGDSWSTTAAAATVAVIADPRGHDFDAGIYAADVVRAALEELFSNKCAYCEGPLPEQFDVEHFRPKGRVAENKDHPGYYWLAYTWTNLLPSCIPCNQRRKDKPIWGDLQYGITGGKFDQFPLVEEDRRALSHNDELVFEDPLLLDPCATNPEQHIKYLVNGEIVATDPHGDATIHICNLKRRRLRKARQIQINRAIGYLELIRDLNAEGKTDQLDRIEGFLERELLHESNHFAGAVRCVANHPEAFGI